MAKVWCAEIDCEHNKNNQCKAKEINLSAGYMHTVHEGFRQVWTCRTFQMDERDKEPYTAFNLFVERGADNG